MAAELPKSISSGGKAFHGSRRPAADELVEDIVRKQDSTLPTKSSARNRMNLSESGTPNPLFFNGLQVTKEWNGSSIGQGWFVGYGSGREISGLLRGS